MTKHINLPLKADHFNMCVYILPSNPFIHSFNFISIHSILYAKHYSRYCRFSRKETKFPALWSRHCGRVKHTHTHIFQVMIGI